MDHEVHDLAGLNGAKIVGRRPEVVDVVGQELPGRGEEQHEPAGEHQRSRKGEEQRSAITDQRADESRSRIVVISHVQ